MTKQEFIDWVLKRLPPIPDKVDSECVIRIVEQCHRNGYTKEDALKVTRLTEYISPRLSERYACDRIAEIEAKYGRCKPCKE